jgi:cell division transport system permease protein
MEPKLIQDIPFRDMASSHYMPWLMAVLAFLLTLVFVGAICVGGSIMDLTQAHVTKFTVEIPHTGDASRVIADAVKNVKLILEKTPGFVGLEEVSNARMVELIRPWIGPVESLTELSLPALIDVTFETRTPVDIQSLQGQLREVAAGARLESFDKWQSHIQMFVQSLRLLAYGVVGVILAAIIMMVVLVTKSSLIAYQGIINTLRLLGAPHSYIAGQFQGQAFMVALKGCLIGMALTVPVIGVFAWLASYFDIPYLLRQAPSLPAILALSLMPFGVGLICMGVARWTVLRTLARLNRPYV